MARAPLASLLVCVAFTAACAAPADVTRDAAAVDAAQPDAGPREPPTVDAGAAPIPGLVPAPAQLESRAGALLIGPRTAVRADESLRAEARWWVSQLTATDGTAPEVLDSSALVGEPTITLSIDASLAAEGYVLDVDAEGARIAGGDGAGVLYGLVTLRQLLPPSSFAGVSADAALRVGVVHVEDAPRFAHRGLMFDEARYFFGGDVVRWLIDSMVLHKLNTLHWHLTDDQGWRIEIRAWPRLTSVGGFRAGSQRGDWFGDTDEVDWTPHGGFYTQDEIRAIVAYAAERHVTIVPEIDVPGHSTAALAAYPSLGCADEPVEVSPSFGLHEDVLCVCEEQTFSFLESVLDEVMELFPSQVIHVGGDEVPTVRWRESATCAARVDELGLASVDGLHDWTMARLARFLESRGRRAQVWNELLVEGLPDSAIVQHWRGEPDVVGTWLEAGRELTFSRYHPFYLNRDYARVSLEDAYAIEPVPSGLDPSLAGLVRGPEACMWTNWHGTVADLEFQIFPRVAAFAEVGWTPLERRGWVSFESRLRSMTARYDAMGIRWGGPGRAPP